MEKKFITHLRDAPTASKPGLTAAGGMKMQWMIDRRHAGADRFAMNIHTILPGTQARPPKEQLHDAEHGFYFLSGRGSFHIDGTEYPVAPTDAAFVPKNTPHQLKCVGTEPLVYVVVFAPSDDLDHLWEQVGNKA